jgi:hypothetical protein
MPKSEKPSSEPAISMAVAQTPAQPAPVAATPIEAAVEAAISVAELESPDTAGGAHVARRCVSNAAQHGPREQGYPKVLTRQGIAYKGYAERTERRKRTGKLKWPSGPVVR